MSERTKVSVIVPIFNTSIYLKRCLDSLSAQTLSEMEFILVDDGSIDNSKDICEEYILKDNRFKLLSQENRGQSCARNNGIKIADGEFIGFVDSDDWVDLDYFEKLYLSAKNNNADIACCGFIKKGKNKHKIRLEFEEEKIVESIEDKLSSTKFLREPCVWNKIYRRNLFFEYNLFFKEGMYYEDGIFSLRALYFSKKLVCVPKINYYYFANPKSTVKTWDEKKTNDLYCAKQQVLNFIREKNIQIKQDSFLMPKFVFKIFNTPVLEKFESVKTNNYYLFRILPIFKTEFKASPKPLLTVITVTKNLIEANRKRDFICCINSVNNQTYDNIEHIVIDGASTDGTLELLNEFQEKGYIKYYSQPDKGIYNAFNKGIKKANGKYIAFLNSDDCWHKSDGIAKTIEQLEKNNSDFAFSPAKLISSDKIRIQKGKIYAGTTRMAVCHQTLFVKTQVINDIGGFDESYKISADYNLFVDLITKKYKYVKINYLFTSFSAGGASSDKLKSEEEVIKIMQKHLSEISPINIDETKQIFKSQALPVRYWGKALSAFKLTDKVHFIILNIKNHIKKIFTKKIIDIKLINS